MNTETLSLRLRRYRSMIAASIRGEEQDYTTLDLRRAVILLSIPMMLELALESVFAITNIFFVNRLGTHAVSVVGLTESVITLVYSVAIGLSSAATAIVARRVGEKNFSGASHAGAQSILLATVVAFLLGIPGYLFSERILSLMGAEPEAIASASGYTRIIFAGNLVIVLLFLINGIFRGAGKPAVAMKSLWLGNAVNIVLDPLLIFGLGPIPGIGIEGAAVASVIGRGTGVIYQCIQLRNTAGTLQFHASQFVPDWKIIRSLVNIAWPATFQFIIASASWIVLAALVAKHGSEASAGYQTAIRLVVFFILPAWGMSNAVATLVGQNLGAGLPLRAEQSVWITCRYNAAFMAFVTVFLLFFSEPLAGFFIPDAQTEQLGYATAALRIISSAYIFYGIGMVLTQAFNGAGDTVTPTWIYFFAFWLFQIPLAFLFHHYSDLGATGIFIAVPVAETLLAIAIFIFFRKGKWKEVKV
jgi:putative MATE family efflux protein